MNKVLVKLYNTFDYHSNNLLFLRNVSILLVLEGNICKVKWQILRGLFQQ